MLVYANAFELRPTNGPTDIIYKLANWASKKTGTTLIPSALANGVARYEAPNRTTVSAEATTVETDDVREWSYPFMWSMTLSHPDERTRGRTWTVEYGLHHDSPDECVKFSIVLRTDETSAAVDAPVVVTRPTIVEDLMKQCNPGPSTPGVRLKSLSLGDAAQGYLREVERTDRRHPLVVVSHRDAARPDTAERIRAVVMGLADVVEIPASVDTFTLQTEIGRDYIAFGGAIRIIHVLPLRASDKRVWSKMFRPEEVETMARQDGGVPSAILKAITAMTNSRMQEKHVNTNLVRGRRIALQMQTLRAQLHRNDHQSSPEEIDLLVQLAADQERASEARLQEERRAREEATDERDEFQAKADALEYQLVELRQKNKKTQTYDEYQQNGIDKLASTLNDDRPKLYDVLCLVSAIYSNEIVVLSSAYKSAMESDQGAFREGKKALLLLQKLGYSYASALRDGKTEQDAIANFGKNEIALNEGNELSPQGRIARTFQHSNEKILMERHLKHGAKDSVAETLRIHFAWHPADRKVIIGHCGRHLDR
jgi:hypothetical protein